MGHTHGLMKSGALEGLMGRERFSWLVSGWKMKFPSEWFELWCVHLGAVFLMIRINKALSGELILRKKRSLEAEAPFLGDRD